MAAVISRGLSLVVVAGYLLAALLSEPTPPPAGRAPGPFVGRAGAAVGVGAASLLPLALIWFPEVIGSATGAVGHGHVDHETPPVLIVLAGWFLLVGLPAVLYFIRRE